MKILLLDGMNLIHRARSGWLKGPHAITFNFYRNLKPILEKFQPDQAYFVLEGKPLHRIEMLPEYKATRKSQPDSFWRQKDEILSILAKLPIVQVKHPKYECDDVIANLARHHLDCDDQVIIVSNDTDFIQLFDTFNNDKFSIWNPRKKQYVESPDYNYLEWKSLCGDTSDNIPGIKGVGNKTAQKLLSDPSKLSEFLSKSDNRSVFQRNKNLIQFEWFESLSCLEISKPSVSLDSVKKDFESAGFASMLKDSYWSKFQNSFSSLVVE